MEANAIYDAAQIKRQRLVDLQRESQEVILKKLPEALAEVWWQEQSRAFRRADKLNILPLIVEFQQVFAFGPAIRYELGWAEAWQEKDSDLNPLYKARWWICEYSSGVYFIYDSADDLQYVGSACGGALGNRIFSKWHHEHRAFVDLVLFPREWCHFALAFETLAISRLKPKHNGTAKQLWIDPQPPFDRIWRMPEPPADPSQVKPEAPTDGQG
jgi:hypothetical protein